MVAIKRELIFYLTIPLIFTIGILVFFKILPQEIVTISNFISYTSSLATLLMVLIVIFTTQQQLNEMKNTRILQTQPLPFITPSKESHLERPTFFYDYPISKAELLCRIFVLFEIQNLEMQARLQWISFLN